MALKLPLGLEGALENALQPEIAATFQLDGAHFRRVAAGWAYPRHDHPGFELNYVVEGSQETELTGRHLVQQAGDLVLFAPGDAHASRNAGNEPMGYYCMHFDVDDPLLRRLLVLSGTRLHTADDAVTEALAPGLTRLIGLARRPPEQALVERLETISALFELLAAMGRALATQFDTAPPVPAPILQIANRLAGWIAEQVEAPDTEQPIETLIRRIGYSPAHGNALFARVYGIPPRQYRSRLKLRRAHLLLLDSGLSVQQVADAMGYGEVSHFSRQFKRWSGLSPQAYRQQQARG